MVKLKLLFLAFSFLILLTNYSFGQGCSDAGFCTISSFKPNGDSLKELNNQFSVGAFFGKADNAISAYGNYLEFNRQFNKKFGVDIKLTTLFHAVSRDQFYWSVSPKQQSHS